MDSSVETRFACDAMLGGLARWLRAAGYDTSWQEGIHDHDLIRLSRHEGRTLLSSDMGIFRFAVIRDNMQPALFVPLQVSPIQQLRHVLEKLHLQLNDPRCMACGGELVEVPKELVENRVPPRTRLAGEFLGMCPLPARLLARDALAEYHGSVTACNCRGK